MNAPFFRIHKVTKKAMWSSEPVVLVIPGEFPFFEFWINLQEMVVVLFENTTVVHHVHADRQEIQLVYIQNNVAAIPVGYFDHLARLENVEIVLELWILFNDHVLCHIQLPRNRSNTFIFTNSIIRIGEILVIYDDLVARPVVDAFLTYVLEGIVELCFIEAIDRILDNIGEIIIAHLIQCMMLVLPHKASHGIEIKIEVRE